MSSQQPQQTNLTLLNLPSAQNPPSNPDTPSEMPGTPTSTTTSLSTLSTTAIKDGHRGHHNHAVPGQRGHHHNLSTNSLEAERADRISRLPGFSAVQTTRHPTGPQSSSAHNAPSAQTTPTSSGFPGNSGLVVTASNAPGGLTPAFFDNNGQPVANTKMSSVGTASATESVGGRTTTETETGADHDMLGDEADEDMVSYRGADTEDANSGYMMLGPADAMDEDLTSRSVGGFEDRMSDDGTASLVGFGEGAGSTISGPIYHRRPFPGAGGRGGSSAGAMERMIWGLERSSSGLSEGAMLGSSASARRDTVRGLPESQSMGLSQILSQTSSDPQTPVSAAALMERREARMVDGVAMDGPAAAAAVASGVADDDMFVDTTTRGPVSIQPPTSALRETQQPNSLYQQQQRQQQLQQRLNLQQQHMQQQQHAHNRHYQQAGSSSAEAMERVLRERLDDGESRMGNGNPALNNPQGNERLGRFYFEERK